MQVVVVVPACIIMAPGQLCLIWTPLSSGNRPLSVVVPLVGLKSKTPLLVRMFSVRRTLVSEQLFILRIILLLIVILKAPTPKSTAMARQMFILTM